MKKRILSMLLSAAVFVGFSLSASAAAEVFTDDFSGAALGESYAATPGVSVADGKMKFQAESAALVGVTLTKTPIENFTLEFDCNISEIGGSQFGIITGISADAADKAPSYAALGASSIMSNGLDSTFVYKGDINAPAVRYWVPIATGTDIHVRLSVNGDEVSYAYQKAGEESYTSIISTGQSAISAQNGYVAVVMNAAGIVTIDNISLVDLNAADPTPDPTPDPDEPYVWEDNFDDRTEHGFANNVADTDGSVSIVDGKLKFDKVIDAQGVFLPTEAMKNKFAMSFDLNMQDGSACPAFLFGIDDAQTPVMYWNSSVDRLSFYMDKYMLGRGEKQLDYEAGSGKDTDVVASSAAFYPMEWSALEKAEDEYLNVLLVFDEENGENVLRVYYKLNTAPESELSVLRSVWKGVQPEGYIGIVAQGNKSADFTIDNIKITEELPVITPPAPPQDEDPTDNPSDDSQSSDNPINPPAEGNDKNEDNTQTGVPSALPVGMIMLAVSGAVIAVVKRKGYIR